MGKKQIAFFILIVLAIIMIVIIAKVQYKSIINNRRYNRIRTSQNDILYNNIIGDINHDLVKELTRNLTKANRTVHEDIMLGNIWKNVMHDDHIAQTHYDEALNKVIRIPEQPNIVDEVELNDYYQLLNHFDDVDDVQAIQTGIISTVVDSPRIHQLEARKEIRSDPQNVHDSNVGAQMKKDYTFIKTFLGNDCATKAEYDTIRALFKGKVKDEYFAFHKYYNNFELFGDPESIIFANIWKYINHPLQKCTTLLQDGFIDAMKDSFEKNSYGEGLVCTNGRIAKLMGCLVIGDINGLGNYRTDQLVRNECFELAVKMRNNKLEESSQDVRDAYNNNESSDTYSTFMKELIEDIEKQIHNKYNGYDDKKMQIIMSEIEAFI